MKIIKQINQINLSINDFINSLLNEIKTQVQSILQKVLGDRFILTNPSFYTTIEEDDGIIVLGDLVQS